MKCKENSKLNTYMKFLKMYPGPLQVSCNFVCHYGSEKKKDENVVKSFLKGK